MTTASSTTSQPDRITYQMDERETLRRSLERVTAERDALTARLAQAEQEHISFRASYLHELYELRERIRGTLTGRMDRMLQTARDAALRLNEPTSFDAEVVIERLEIITETLAAFVATEQNPPR